MPFSAREFDYVIRKFGFATRGGDHLRAELRLDERIIVKTARSWQSSGDLPMWRAILRQMKLSPDEFTAARRCTLSRERYYELLAERIPQQ